MKAYLQNHRTMLIATLLVVAAMLFGIIPPGHDAMAGAILFGLNTTAFAVNPELTAIAIAYQNPASALIADEVLPRVPTAKKFKYTKYTVEQGYTVPDTKVGRKSEPNMVDFGGTDVTDECVDYGLDDLVPVDEIEAYNAMAKPSVGGPVSPEALSTMMLTGLVQLDREIRTANLVFNAANYSGANQSTLVAGSQWSDPLNSNPLNAILQALDIPLVRPNQMVIGQQSWTMLRQHPKIIQAIGKSAQLGGNASLAEVAALLELDRILVGRGFYNTAKKGQAPVYTRAWGKHCALLHVDSLAAQLGQPTFGWTAQFGTRIAGTIPEPKAGLRGGSRIRSGESVKEVIVSQDAGYFFQNCVA